MKILIDISEEDYEKIKKVYTCIFGDIYYIMQSAIAKGTPLPTIIEADTESEEKQMTREKETLTVSKFIDILKNLPGDSPIVIVKDDSDDRHDGCYHVMEVAMLHSDYEKKNDAVGLSISNNPIELLSSNYNCTLYTAYRDTESEKV